MQWAWTVYSALSTIPFAQLYSNSSFSEFIYVFLVLHTKQKRKALQKYVGTASKKEKEKKIDIEN